MKLTQEQVIAWAREAGFEEFILDEVNGVPVYELSESKVVLQRAFTLAYEAGRAAENEACAGFLVDYAKRFDDIRCAALEVAAEYIRARREQ